MTHHRDPATIHSRFDSCRVSGSEGSGKHWPAVKLRTENCDGKGRHVFSWLAVSSFDDPDFEEPGRSMSKVVRTRAGIWTLRP